MRQNFLVCTSFILVHVPALWKKIWKHNDSSKCTHNLLTAFRERENATFYFSKVLKTRLQASQTSLKLAVEAGVAEGLFQGLQHTSLDLTLEPKSHPKII